MVFTNCPLPSQYVLAPLGMPASGWFHDVVHKNCKCGAFCAGSLPKVRLEWPCPSGQVQFMKVQKSPWAEIMKGLIYIKSHCELGAGAKCSSEFIIKEPKKSIKG